MKPTTRSMFFRSHCLLAAAALTSLAHAATFTWTQNSVATQTWTTAANWASSNVFVSDPTNELTFFSDTTTALVNGTNNIATSVPAALSMNILTLNGKGADATANSTVNIASTGSTWTLDGTSPTVNLNGVIGTGSPVRLLSYDVKANLSLTQADTLFTGNGTAGFRFSGLISATSATNTITKTGTSGLTLTNTTNSFGGDVYVNSGILDAHRGSLGTTVGETYVNSTGSTSLGGQLSINSNGVTYSESENVVIQGTGNNASGAGTAALRFTGLTPINMNGSITLDGNANYKIDVYLQPTHPKINAGITRSGANTGILFFNLSHYQLTDPVRLTINSPIDNNGGALTLLGNTAGILKMDTAGHDIGAVTINGEYTPTYKTVLQLAISDALATDQNLTITKGTFDLGGFNQTVNALSGVTLVSLVTNSGSADSNLTVGNGGGTATFAGVIQDGATNKVSLEKTGSGTQTLSGANTYSGNTSVSGGTLVLKQINTFNELSTVTIASGAFLGLDFVGTDTVDKLFFGAAQQPSGTYSASSVPAGATITTASFSSSGSLTVTAGPAPVSGFSTWITGTFNGNTVPEGQQGPNDDPDGDGISNLVEYAIDGQDPTVPSGAVGALNGKILSFSKRLPLASDITYAIESSTDLGIADVWEVVTPTVNDGTTISYTLPDGPAKDFARLKITQP